VAKVIANNTLEQSEKNLNFMQFNGQRKVAQMNQNQEFSNFQDWAKILNK